MAASAKEAYDAGASAASPLPKSNTRSRSFSVMGAGCAAAVTDAVRAACPDVIINMSTGVIDLDQSAPIAAWIESNQNRRAMRARSTI